MEVVSWARLTSELGVAYTPVVAWSDQPALAEAARNAVSEQAAQDADVSSDDEAEDNRAAARGSGRRRSPVLWRLSKDFIRSAWAACRPAALQA